MEVGCEVVHWDELGGELGDSSRFRLLRCSQKMSLSHCSPKHALLQGFSNSHKK
jgi:hypothetical protein